VEKAFNVVVKCLADYLKPPITFAYLTGWRCRSEILPLPWRNVDFEASTIRLDVGSTKNKLLMRGQCDVGALRSQSYRRTLSNR